MNDHSQHSVLSDEDIDYWDKTEEDIISPCMTRRRSKRQPKRPSAPPEEELNNTPPKRHKAGIKTEVIFSKTCLSLVQGKYMRNKLTTFLRTSYCSFQ